jgi:hypothetical protein
VLFRSVYKINDELALIQTTDFFSPVCSDPFEFGQIAAANALSDVYAMGGEVLTALNLAMFPSRKIPLDVLREILLGGQEKVEEAGPVYDGSIEVRLDDKGGVDEIVGMGVLFHIERMNSGQWFFILTRPDQTQEAFWLSGKGKVEVSHSEHRPAPTTGPNAEPWTLSDIRKAGE